MGTLEKEVEGIPRQVKYFFNNESYTVCFILQYLGLLLSTLGLLSSRASGCLQYGEQKVGKKKWKNLPSARQVLSYLTELIIHLAAPIKEHFYHIQIVERWDCSLHTDWFPSCVISYSLGLKIKQLLGFIHLFLYTSSFLPQQHQDLGCLKFIPASIFFTNSPSP